MLQRTPSHTGCSKRADITPTMPRRRSAAHRLDGIRALARLLRYGCGRPGLQPGRHGGRTVIWCSPACHGSVTPSSDAGAPAGHTAEPGRHSRPPAGGRTGSLVSSRSDMPVRLDEDLSWASTHRDRSHHGVERPPGTANRACWWDAFGTFRWYHRCEAVERRRLGGRDWDCCLREPRLTRR
jgi:hypothetical protein